jgi:hypothetical protein
MKMPHLSTFLNFSLPKQNLRLHIYRLPCLVSGLPEQIVPSKIVFDLGQSPALGLGHKQVHKQGAGQRGDAKEEEETVRLQIVHRRRVELGGDKQGGVDHCKSEASSGTARPRRQHFAQHQPGQHEEAEGVARHVGEHQGGRQPWKGARGWGHVQPAAQRHGGGGRAETRGDCQRPATNLMQKNG